MKYEENLSYDVSEPYVAVHKWLSMCADNSILPWEYDLKNEIYPLTEKIAHENSYVKRILGSWLGEYWEQKTTITLNSKGYKRVLDTETEDSELMQCIYLVLWGLTSKNTYQSVFNLNIDADVMTSFWSPYKSALKATNLKDWQNNVYNKNIGSLKELYDRFDDDGYKDVNSRFEKFAKYAHTIGNMTLTPLGFNALHHNDSQTWRRNLNKTFKDNYQEYNWNILKVENFDEYKNVFLYQYNQLDITYDLKATINENDIEKITTTIPTEIALRGKDMIKILLDKISEKGFDVNRQRKSFFQQ
ncbi:hypothetical protein [Leuconostoc citreum]|uniref:hypothetical protein n=1 Tax=Leuconostoc citreum TaxID=33964 RepID=UPI000C28D1CE|nr:hypothetical protein [Leuconostoc citreum]